MQRIISYIIMLSFLATAGCSAFQSQVEPDASPAGPDVSVQPATATSSPKSESTATSTPTEISIPTPTATEPPTPTPPGFYSQFNAGFSLTYPALWQILEENQDTLILMDDRELLMFIASSRASVEPLDVEDAIEELSEIEAFKSLDKELEWEKGEEIELADGLKAPSYDVIIESQGTEVGLRLVITNAGPREYIFGVISPVETLEERALTLKRIFSSIHFFTPLPYGLERDQTLVQFGYEPDPVGIDPALTMSSAGEYVGLLFSGLVRLSPDLQVEPDLAESWSVSSDGTIYQFTLNEDLKFSSGRELTAQDVKDSWERATDPDTGSQTASTYLGDIIGVQEKLLGKAKEIKGLKVLDAQHLEVTLDGPKPYFLAKLSDPVAFVVDVQQIGFKKGSWSTYPNASGPYQLKEIRSGEAVIFERNPYYHRPAEIQYLVFRVPQGGDLLTLYQDGWVDLLDLDSSQIAQVSKAGHALHKEYHTTQSLCTPLLLVDPNQPPMDDPAVRQALTLALDRQSLAERLSEGTLTAGFTILPPAMPGYSTELDVDPFDVEAAKQALSTSTYQGKLPTITLTTSGYAASERQDVTALVDMWKQNLGLNVQVEYQDPEEFVEQARQEHGQITLFSWCADYPDPQNFLDVLFHSESEFNVFGYQNVEIDQLLEEARVIPDPQARLAQYKQVETKLLEEFITIPLYRPIYSTLAKPALKGFRIQPMDILMIPWLELEREPEK